MDTKISVCIISGAYPPIKSGMADYAEILADRLIELGVDVTVITSRHSGIRPTRRVLPIISGWNMSSWIDILKVLRAIVPSIVHIQYPTFGYSRHLTVNLLPLFIRLFLRDCRVVVTQHEFSIYSLTGRLRSAIHLLFSHRITTPTTGNLQEMARFLPPIRGKASCIPIGSNIPVRPVERSSKDSFTICHFGIVRPRKGLETLIEALSELRRRDFIFLLLGELNSGNPYHETIRRLLTTGGLAGRTRITGYCSEEEVSRFLASADVCVLPFADGVSERRGSLLAALQHQVPTITTRGRFVPEGLVDGVNIKLVSPGDVKKTADTIRELMDDRELRDRIGSGGYEWSRLFTWDSVAERTLSLYLELVNSADQ